MGCYTPYPVDFRRCEYKSTPARWNFPLVGSVFCVSELCRLGALELELQFVRNEGDELRIGGLSLGVADGVTEEPL